MPIESADFTACDREPIHIPGSIQPHGRLLIAQRDGMVVTDAASQDPGWSSAMLHQPLGTVLNGAFAALRPQDLHKTPTVLAAVADDDRIWDCVAYLSGEYLLIEMMPQPAATLLGPVFLSQLDGFGTAMDRAVSQGDLFDLAASLFRDLTGYARVLIYRFLDNDAGTVVGEARDAGMEGFMNHHFPASDIPRQARVLYVRNRVRVITDVHATPAAVIPGLQTIDLSDSMLRSVSPVHLTYLRNMGVGASASMSIVKDGYLWGLVACHHSEPRDLSLTTRLACQAMAASLSRQITLREETELYRERIRLRAQEDMIMLQIGADEDLSVFLTRQAPALARLVAADGFATVRGDTVLTTGSCPSENHIRDLAVHVRKTGATRPVVTSHLSREFPPALAYHDVGSGLLAITMPTEVPAVMMWFRAERLQTVTWAGNPHKDTPADPDAMLQPRTSFAAWSQEVEGHSADWTTAETESAFRLVRQLLEAINVNRTRQLNRDLTTSLRENENLIRQKEFLLREVNHRVQNSLTLVASFLRMQGRGAPDEVREHLEEAQNRLNAVSLVHRRLYQDESAEIVDLSIYLADLLKDLRSSLDPGWKPLLKSRLAPVQISTDRAVSIGLLVNEIVTNAAKYAYDGAPGPIMVTLKQQRGNMRLEVADCGRGMDGSIKGSGFGRRMIEALVDQLGGEITTGNRDPGLVVTVTAPTG